MAIARDTSASSFVTTQNMTLSYTTGSLTNGMMQINTFVTSADNVTGVTYNGVSATLVNDSIIDGGGFYYIRSFLLPAPASGTHDVVVSRSSSTGRLEVTVETFSGVDQSTTPDDTTAVHNTTNNVATSVTTTVDGDWITFFTGVGDLVSSVTNGTVQQAVQSGTCGATTNATVLYDSNGSVSAGSNSMTLNICATADSVTVMTALKPFVPSSGFFNLL